uniref:Uncharacterized protein n=1 Tax=Knipowitschia caucasica TaxID=637954 RepID=A0AAV2L1B9_KNICA
MTVPRKGTANARALSLTLDPAEVIFREISDLQKEEEERERAKNEVQLSIPQDHPVRRLLHKFKPRHNGNNGSYTDAETHQTQNLQQLGHSSSQHSLPLSTSFQNGTSNILTVSQITPMQEYSADNRDKLQEDEREPEKLRETGKRETNKRESDKQRESDKHKAAESNSEAVIQTLSKPAKAPSAWMRLKGSAADGARRDSPLTNQKAASAEMLAPSASAPSEEADGENLRKTDSCDSGITKSEQRIDETETVKEALDETRLQLRTDIQALGGRLRRLETQVQMIIQLLSDERREGEREDQAAVPGAAGRGSEKQDIFTVSRPVTPDAHRGRGYEAHRGEGL